MGINPEQGGRFEGTHAIRDELLDLFDGCGWNHGNPMDQLAEPQIGRTIGDKERQGILGLARPRLFRDGIKVKTQIRFGDQVRQQTDVEAIEPASQILVREFVIDPSVKDHDAKTGPTRALENQAGRQPIEGVKKEPDPGHGPRANVLVAALDWPRRGSDSLIAAEDTLPRGFPHPGEASDLIPERNHPDAQPPRGEAVPKRRNLSALARAVDTGKTDGQNPFAGKAGHQLAP